MAKSPHQREFSIRAFLWGLRRIRNERALLQNSFERFSESGETVADYLSNPIWFIRNIGVKLVGAYGLAELADNIRFKSTDYSEAPIVRRNSLRVLHELLDEPDFTTYYTALQDPYWETRTQALKNIADAADSPNSVTETLTDSLINKQGVLIERNFEVQLGYAETLGRVGVHPGCVRAFTALGNAANWLVRAQAAIAITHVSSRFPAASIEYRDLLKTISATTTSMVPFFPLKSCLAHAARSLSQTAGSDIGPPLEYLNLSRGWQNHMLGG